MNKLLSALASIDVSLASDKATILPKTAAFAGAVALTQLTLAGAEQPDHIKRGLHAALPDGLLEEYYATMNS